MPREGTSRRALLAGVVGLAASACDARDVRLRGAGATSPARIYRGLFDAFERRASDVRVDYLPVGSGAGVRHLLAGTVDFGASDVALAPEELGALAERVLELPSAVFGVAIAYRLPGVPALRVSRATLVDLFTGRIRAWDAPALRADNPGVPLPALPVSLVVRSDGSGATAVLARLLARIRPEVAAELGVGRTVAWPHGVGARGSEGVARRIASVPGAIGYVEAESALSSGLSLALVENARGEFVAPSGASLAAAATGAPDAAHVTDADAASAYPLAACTFLLVPHELPDPRRGAALARLLFWLLGEGQGGLDDRASAALPPALADRARASLAVLRSGSTLLSAVD